MKKTYALVFAVASMFVVGTVAHAQIIYFDSFTATDGTQILGRAPELNNGVVGTTYYTPNTVWSEDILGNRARIGADTHASLDIATSGAFTQPTTLRVSAVMNLGTTAGPNTPSDMGTQRGIGLGYYAGEGSVATNDDFRGLVLGTDGRLILAQANVAGSSRAGFVAEIATGIDTAVDHTLSYDINTDTGDISNIVLDSVLQPDVNTTLFNSNVNHVGFFASSSAGGTFAFFDDFTVSAVVPEPTSIAIWSILGLGLAGFGYYRTRRKK